MSKNTFFTLLWLDKGLLKAKELDFRLVWMILMSDTTHYFFHISTTFGSKLLWKVATFEVIYFYRLKSYGIIIVIYSNRNHRNLSFLCLKRVVNAFIKSQQGKKCIFTHFQSKGFENLIWKNNFQRSNSSEYVSNMYHMIQIIILDGSYSHLDLYKGL